MNCDLGGFNFQRFLIHGKLYESRIIFLPWIILFSIFTDVVVQGMVAYALTLGKFTGSKPACSEIFEYFLPVAVFFIFHDRIVANSESFV